MKKWTVLFLLLAVCAVNAQMAPTALDNQFLKSFVGDWKGTSTSSMGDSQDEASFQLGVNDQFLLMTYKSTSDMGPFTGMGAYTIDPQSGNVAAFWIDSMRDMSKGSGKIEGNKMTVEWKGMMMSGTRTVELVDENTFMVSSKFTMPDGSVMESTSEMMRVQMSDK